MGGVKLDATPPAPDSPNAARRAERTLRNKRFVALSLVVTSALFCGVMLGLILAVRFVEGPEPPDLTRVEARIGRLQESPADAGLRDAVRAEDAKARNAFFANRRRIAAGALLLVIGAAVMVAAARWYAVLDPEQRLPGDLAARTSPDHWLGMRRRTVTAVAVGAGVLALALAVMALQGGARFPREPVEDEDAPGGPEVAAADASAEAVDFKENWPRFRGPTGMGLVGGGQWPRQWDGRAGLNVVWKVPVPLPGKGSPIVWGNRVFLTGADADRREVMCFRRSDGQLLWRTPIPSRPAGGDEADTTDLEAFGTGYAAPTPATDGERVYCFFPTADLAAVDFGGRLVWARNLGPPENVYGIATSPIVYDGKVIVQFDRGGGVEEELSALLAFDSRTGEPVWRTPRPVVNSWSTPVVVETEAGPEIITCGAPWVISYDPELGLEVWRAEGLSGDVASSPVYADGTVFVTSEYAVTMALRPGGAGDFGAPEAAWENDEVTMADAASPLCDGKLLFQVHSSGAATCHDAATGSVAWEHEFDDGFWASPALVGDLVYLTGEKGTTYLFRLTDSYVEEAANPLGEQVFATPAFADSLIYIRGEKHLFCIGEVAE